MNKNAPVHLLSRAFNQPLLLDPAYAQYALAFLASRGGAAEFAVGDEVFDPEQLAESYQVKKIRFAGGEYRPYALHDNGVAQISIDGSLVHKGGRLESSSGTLGYDGIREKLEMAADDSRVRGILLDVDSPGGEVRGAFDLAKLVKEINQIKPVAAVSDEMMASAAFLIASPAESIYVGKTSMVGSVGAVVAHFDYSKNLEQNGVKVTLIAAGENKVDGNPYEALPDRVRADIQSRLESTRKEFANVVADGREMDAQAILDTEARVYTGQEAKKIGFADYVIPSMDAVVSHFGNRIRRISNKRKKEMSMPKGTIDDDQIVADARAEGIEEGKKLALKDAQAQIESEKAEAEKAQADAVQAARMQERQRVTDVMAAAGENQEQAKELLDTDLSTDKILAILGKAPEQKITQEELDKASDAAAAKAALTEGAGATPAAEMEKEQADVYSDLLAKMQAKGLVKPTEAK